MCSLLPNNFTIGKAFYRYFIDDENNTLKLITFRTESKSPNILIYMVKDGINILHFNDTRRFTIPLNIDIDTTIVSLSQNPYHTEHGR